MIPFSYAITSILFSYLWRNFEFIYLFQIQIHMEIKKL